MMLLFKRGGVLVEDVSACVHLIDIPALIIKSLFGRIVDAKAEEHGRLIIVQVRVETIFQTVRFFAGPAISRHSKSECVDLGKGTNGSR